MGDDPFGKTRVVLLIRAVDLLGSPVITKYVVPKLLRIFSVFYCNKLRKEIARRNVLAGKSVTTNFPPADRGGDEHDIAPSLEDKNVAHAVHHSCGLEEERHATSHVKMEEVNGKERNCADGLNHSSAIENMVRFPAFPAFPEADFVLADFQDFFDDITSVVKEDRADDYSSTDAWVHW